MPRHCPAPLPLLDLALPDAAATDAFAERLAPLLRGGDALLLTGSLGAGKTQLARAIIQTLQAAHGTPEDVPSPTYTLVQEYQAGALHIVHADLYRLAGPGEATELALDDLWDTALCLIEWPDRLGDAAPRDALHVTLAQDGEGRRLVLSSANDGWAARLKSLAPC
ncbi:tRNA (adenosine(37)-N6)-threonylcarbamoyltransferase complex ATPase subunit type 1 TsaE [Oceaniovalibus guishaninsula]